MISGCRQILLFVGRVDDDRKGLSYLMHAFKKVVSEVDALLLIAGAGDQRACRKLAHSLGIDKEVVFAGYVDDATLGKMFHLCDVHVVPSLLEGFGLTLLEAMAAGKPTVATRVGAIPEVLGDAGIMVAPGDCAALGAAIVGVLRDPVKRECLARNARNRVDARFEFQVVANVY